MAKRKSSLAMSARGARSAAWRSGYRRWALPMGYVCASALRHPVRDCVTSWRPIGLGSPYLGMNWAFQNRRSNNAGAINGGPRPSSNRRQSQR